MTTPTPIPLPMLGGITGGLSSFTTHMWDSVPFIHSFSWVWIKWGSIVCIVLLPFLWLYKNFWKYSSGELPKKGKHEPV
jgi:hypothetical protein